MFLKNREVIVLIFLSLFGYLIGQLAYNFVEVHQIIYPLLKTPSYSLYSLFLPLITFMAALEVDFYILKNLYWQVLLTGAISIIAEFVIISYVVMRFKENLWDLQCTLLFSIAVSIIDPIHSVNSLQTIGVSKIYTDIIRGESLIICSITCIFFGVFRGSSLHISKFRELHVIIGVSLDIFGSIVGGYWCSRVIQLILTDIFNNTLTNIVLCFSLVYITFYIVEYFGMSGIVALVTVGLNLDSLSFKPRMESVVTKFLIMFSSVFQQLIYTFFGIVIGCGGNKYFDIHSGVFLFSLFVAVNAVRLLTIILVSPILMHLNYEYNWQWAIVIAWSGIRGVFSILLAPDIYNLAEQKVLFPHMFVFYAQAISLLTMGINSYMMIQSARTLGLCVISLPRQIVMQNATEHIQGIIQNTMTLYKTEKLLTNVNWTLVEKNVKIEYIIPPGPLQNSGYSLDDAREEILTDELLTEEARFHVAIIQMSSFEKQCNDGILGVDAARILIGAAKSYCYIPGKFMTIYDVSNYVKARSWLIKFKTVLTFLEYHKEKAPFLSLGIVYSKYFEFAGHIIPFLYVYPMMIHLWPAARAFNVSALIGVNYYFLSLYVLQSTLKMMIPLLIKVTDMYIKRHLSLMYSITRGYVKGQEDAELLVKQISGNESIHHKLCEILEKNKRDAIKELGRIEHEGRDVVIALKTKQAVQNVIAKALKNLIFLWSRGIIDKHEGIEMNKVLLNKIKALNNFPMAIPPPTPDRYLSNVVWLENKDVLIEFFKERAKLVYFDYGDIICKEGEMPQGIFLIISGMASLHSSSLNFGLDCSQRSFRKGKGLFTEYCTGGEILGELSCLLKQEIRYTAICETTLQAFFVSLEDLYEGFDIFWPSLEYKMWLKLALYTACQYFGPNLADEDLRFQKCVADNHVYVETLSIFNEMTINHETMKFAIIVYGSVINSRTEEQYLAPCIVPKTCDQIQGTADLSKLLIIQAMGPETTDQSSSLSGLLEKFGKCWKPDLELEKEHDHTGPGWRRGLWEEVATAACIAHTFKGRHKFSRARAHCGQGEGADCWESTGHMKKWARQHDGAGHGSPLCL
ncbi:sodium/hydrogen exchanger 11 [Ctenodactylus gundi]